jgi:hypothetical protein
VSEDTGFLGIRGWLAVLVVVVGGLAPLGQISSFLALLKAEPLLAPRYGANWPVYFQVTATIIGIRILVCLFVARELLYKRQSSTPRRAIIGIWIAYGLLNILSLTIALMFIPGPVRLAGALQNVIWALVICGIATAYLIKSKRVAETYRS